MKPYEWGDDPWERVRLAEMRVEKLEHEREIVRRMAVHGVSKGTTPDEALETIANYIAIRVERERADG